MKKAGSYSTIKVKLCSKMNTMLVCFLTAGFMLSCSDTQQGERLFAHFLNRHVERIKPINQKYNEAVWETYTGKSTFGELYDKTRITDSLLRKLNEPIHFYQGLLHNVYDNTSEFELLLKIKQSGLINDPLLKRQFINVFRNYTINQNNWNQSNAIKTALFESFYELKKNETAYWDSVKSHPTNEPGKEWVRRFASLTDQFRDLVMTMNQEVAQLGYDNYYQCILDVYGVDYRSLDAFCELIERETADDYRHLLQLCQKEICLRKGLTPGEIHPEHYRDCNEAMMIPKNWQREYTKDEMLDVLRQYFALGGFGIDKIIENSEIWYDPDKLNQSFFLCADLDKGDHRIYANIRPNTRGVYIMLHEFAHAVHYQSVDHKVPYLLKEPHLVTLEGLGIYFNEKIYTSEKLRKMMGIEQEASNPFFEEFLSPSTLVFLRKAIRNIQFEKAIYEHPAQDFNQLWWDLTRKYLMYDDVREEDRLPEWISNHHIITASGMHVIYLYAYAFAAQLEHFYPDENFAELKEKFMQHGDAFDWNDLLLQATGEPLNLSFLFNSYRKIPQESRPIAFEIKKREGLISLRMNREIEKREQLLKAQRSS